MIALLLLLGLSSGQLATTELTSATFAFSQTHTMKGEIVSPNADAFVIQVTDPAVVQLRAYLQVTTGDADLLVYTTVNGDHVVWSSGYSGSDTIIIQNTDPAFTDGYGYELLRQFTFVVFGFSSYTVSYELTVTAEYAISYIADSATSLPDFITANQQLEVMQVKMTDYPVSLPESSSVWPWVCAVSIGTVIGLALWTRRRLEKKDTEYVVL